MSILDYIERIKRENEGPRITAQEPRNMADGGRIGFSEGADYQKKMEEVFKAYKDYKKLPRRKNPIMSFRKFLPIYAKENFAEGGRIGYDDGQLVAPTVDGSRPGYNGKKQSVSMKKASKEARALYRDKALVSKIIELVKKEPDDYSGVLKKINSYKNNIYKYSSNDLTRVITQLAADNKLNSKYKVTKIEGKPQYIINKRNKKIDQLVSQKTLPTAKKIGEEVGASVTTVTKYLKDTKGEEWLDKNYGEIRFTRYGDTPLKKQFLDFVNNNPVENFTMKNILKNTDIKTKTEANDIFSKMMADVYDKRVILRDRPVLYIDESIDLKKLTTKLRSSKDFVDQYERSMGSLILEAFGGDAKNPGYQKARKILTSYNNLIRPLNKKYPSLAQVIEHPIPYTFLKEVRAGKDPLSLINVTVLGDKENTFKSKIDQAKIKLRRQLALDPKNKTLLTQLGDMGKLENLLSKETGLQFGKVKSKFTDPNVKNIEFGGSQFGTKKLVPQIEKSLKIRERLADFYNKFKNDKTVQEVFKKAGIGPKIFGMLGRLRKGNIKGFLKQMDEVLKENPGLRVQFEDEFKDIQNQYAALDTGTMTDAGMKIDFSMPPVKEAGLPSEVISAGTLPIMKYGKKLISGLGKGIAGIDLPPIQLAFALADPTTLAYTLPFSNLAAEQTGMYKPAKTKLGKWAKAAARGMPRKVAQNVLPFVSRASIPFSLAYGVSEVAKAAKPDYYIDPKTQEPTFYKREKAADVFPTFLDIYDQAQNIAKEQGISYKEALQKIDPSRFYNLNKASEGIMNLKTKW